MCVCVTDSELLCHSHLEVPADFGPSGQAQPRRFPLDLQCLRYGQRFQRLELTSPRVFQDVATPPCLTWRLAWTVGDASAVEP